MDLIDDGTAPGNAPEFSVTELSGAIKRVIEGEFAHVRIRGEVGRVSRPRSGHVYLDLKDDKSVIAGVMWKGVASRLQTQPEEGMEVIATGRITTFGGQSKYQIVIEDIKPAGMGALMALLEKRRAMLDQEGLFDPARKRPLPYLPEVIGVVTSPSGAVIRDILHRLRDRFPRKVLIWPVAVQGARCAPEVARAIEGFNALSPGGALPRPDLIIVARGGGSVEDLWGFNEEVVARAVAGSAIPLISAVGHETDTTLIDHVADMRAPTPTAAAELAVPVRHELLAGLEAQGARATHAMSGLLVRWAQRSADLGRALPKPQKLIEGPAQRFDALSEKLGPALIAGVQRRKVNLSEAAGSLRPQTLRTRMQNERRRLESAAQRLAPALQRATRAKADQLAARTRSFDPAKLTLKTAQSQRDLTRITQRLSRVGQGQVAELRQRLEAMDRLRETLSYKATLQRGYAVVRTGSEVITTAQAAKSATTLEVEFADGTVTLGSRAPQKVSKKQTPPPEQGSLL